MVILKSRDEIATMRRAGRVVARTLERVVAAVRPGVTLRELDELGARTIAREGATASFLGYHPRFAPTPFPASLCLSVNEVIVHGIPDRSRLRAGDVLSIDCGAVVDGYHADAAVTVPVGEIDPAARRLLEATEQALWAGIAQARVGNRLSDISHAVGQVAHAAGYGILADHGGHGVGQLLHEDPSVDNDGRPGRGPRLRDGLVLAIEPMFVDGDPAYVHRPDGWAVATRDGSWSAHFEHTVAVLDEGPEPLTVPSDEPVRDLLVELAAVAAGVVVDGRLVGLAEGGGAPQQQQHGRDQPDHVQGLARPDQQRHHQGDGAEAAEQVEPPVGVALAVDDGADQVDRGQAEPAHDQDVEQRGQGHARPDEHHDPGAQDAHARQDQPGPGLAGAAEGVDQPHHAPAEQEQAQHPLDQPQPGPGVDQQDQAADEGQEPGQPQGPRLGDRLAERKPAPGRRRLPAICLTPCARGTSGPKRARCRDALSSPVQGEIGPAQAAGSRSRGQLMQRGPPRPRPSSKPGMVRTSTPSSRRRWLVSTLRS